MVEGPIDVIRTRDEADYAGCDFRIDVGGRNNPATGDYDHHMAGGAGCRTNGVPYAACGLVWREYGNRITGSERITEVIDAHIIQTIDALDCGYRAAREGFPTYSFADALDAFNPPYTRDQDTDESFHEAVRFADQVIRREIEKLKAEHAAEAVVRAAVERNRGKSYLLLEEFLPWQSTVCRYPEFMYVIFPDRSGSGYRVRAVPVSEESFEVRRALPIAWAGLRDTELAAASGVPDATFCHPARFIAGARSLAGAVALAELALR
jgi:uncharacterized UPF0160 family protein